MEFLDGDAFTLGLCLFLRDAFKAFGFSLRVFGLEGFTFPLRTSSRAFLVGRMRTLADVALRWTRNSDLVSGEAQAAGIRHSADFKMPAFDELLAKSGLANQIDERGAALRSIGEKETHREALKGAGPLAEGNCFQLCFVSIRKIRSSRRVIEGTTEALAVRQVLGQSTLRDRNRKRLRLWYYWDRNYWFRSMPVALVVALRVGLAV